MYHLASPHDFGVPQVIVEEAGGICTDLNGKLIKYDSNFNRVPWFLAFFDALTMNEFFSTMSKIKPD
jgi:3'-phosphoadenosine 5'-phosphosulfate (PAPS) 3'-phosphatase